MIISILFSQILYITRIIYTPQLILTHTNMDFLEYEANSYCDNHLLGYQVTHHTGGLDEHRRPFGTSSENRDTPMATNTIRVWCPNTTFIDTISYAAEEELLDLGETVGTENRRLSKEAISCLPVTRYKRWFCWRRKSRNERCVVCQMEYKRGDKQITLPCGHVYHSGCGAKWLSSNKACPVCYTDVVIRKPKPKKK